MSHAQTNAHETRTDSQTTDELRDPPVNASFLEPTAVCTACNHDDSISDASMETYDLQIASPSDPAIIQVQLYCSGCDRIEWIVVNADHQPLYAADRATTFTND